jgi:hypothetical protein
MRFRLLRRRLTISAPKMAIRSTLPWPLRWVLVAVVLGVCAAIGLWVFEFGRELSGLDRQSKEELPRLRSEVNRLTAERDKAQSIANTAGSLLAAGQATQDRLVSQNKQLEVDNRSLRDDLGFFEKLLPVSDSGGIAVRGLQAEVLAGTQQLKWQVLVFQAVKNPAEFSGRLEMTFVGLRNGKPWLMPLPESAQALQFRQYRRMEGVLDLPADVTLKTVSAKIMDGSTVRATHSLKL